MTDHFFEGFKILIRFLLITRIYAIIPISDRIYQSNKISRLGVSLKLEVLETFLSAIGVTLLLGLSSPAIYFPLKHTNKSHE